MNGDTLTVERGLTQPTVFVVGRPVGAEQVYCLNCGALVWRKMFRNWKTKRENWRYFAHFDGGRIYDCLDCGRPLAKNSVTTDPEEVSRRQEAERKAMRATEKPAAEVDAAALEARTVLLFARLSNLPADTRGRSLDAFEALVGGLERILELSGADVTART